MVQGASDLLTAALAPSTRIAYRKAWSKFEQFSRSVITGSAFPALTSTIALYISSLVTPPCHSSPATIATNVSAISYYHKLAGVQDPTAQFIVRKIMHGLTKMNPASDLRVPITPSALLSLVQSVKTAATSPYDTHLFPAMFTLMFHGFLRIGEVTGAQHNITYHQAVCTREAIALTFISFKHHSGQPFTLHIGKSPVVVACPVRLLAAYVKVRGSSPGPLFCDGANNPISPGRFRAVLRTALAHANLSTLHITPHSFRIGAATYAATKGMSAQQIQAMGRWQSSAFQKYVRISSISLPSTM